MNKRMYAMTEFWINGKIYQVVTGETNFCDRIDIFRIWQGQKGSWLGAVIHRHNGWWEII